MAIGWLIAYRTENSCSCCNFLLTYVTSQTRYSSVWNIFGLTIIENIFIQKAKWREKKNHDKMHYILILFPFCLFIIFFFLEKIFVNSLDFWEYYIVITKFLSVHCWISTNFLRPRAILGPSPNLGLVDSAISFTQNPWLSL